MSAKILLVEDDPWFLRQVVPALKERGLEVTEASDGREANRLLDKESFDLVVVDGLLPDTDGMTWIEQCRRSGRTFKTVFVSAFWRDPESFRKLTTELGVSLVVHKPIVPSAFVQQLESQLPATAEPAAASGLTDELIALQNEYAAGLPAKVAELAAAVERARERHADPLLLGEARTLAHRLGGAAGSYGFHGISSTAGLIEDALQALVAGRAPEGTWSVIQGALAEAAHQAEAGARGTAATGTDALALPSSRVLVVDPDPGFLEFTRQVGGRQLIEIIPVRTAREALARARAGALDAALIDVQPGVGDGFQLAREIRALPACQDLPLAVLSSDGGTEQRVAAIHAGASLFLAKPVDTDTLGIALRQLAEQQIPHRFHVLLIDDDVAFTRRATAVLRQAGMYVTGINDSSRVLETLQRSKPDLVLLDEVMPGIGGFDICRMLRGSPEWQTLPILFLTTRLGTADRLLAFQAGADDYLVKPVLNEELLTRVRLRAERARMLQDKMDRDGLTGLLMRRSFVERLSARLHEAIRREAPLSVCLLDLDHFKRINDTAGHLAGDNVLAMLGRLLASRFRTEDLRGRWGGEEFALAFPNESAEVVEGAVKRALKEFSEVAFGDEHGGHFSVTFSAGLANFPGDGQTVQDLLRVADRRLYLAKRAGRSRVVREG